MKRIILYFLIFSILAPVGVSARGIDEIGKIEFSRLNFDEVPGIEIGEAIDFFKKAEETGAKVYRLVSKLWAIASLLIEKVTGLTLGELFTSFVNVAIGIIETMVNLLDNVI